MELAKHTTHGARRWWLMLLFSLVSAIPRLFYTNVPFERDEGAYAYISDIIQRGGLPYLDAFDHKPPAVFYLYRLAMMLFGHTIAAPRLMAALFVVATSFLVMLLVFRFTRNLAGSVIAGIILGVASSSPAYLGFNANTEIFSLPFITGGVLLLAAEDLNYRCYFWSGVLFGLGIMVKQPTVMVAAAAFGVHFLRAPRQVPKNGPVFILGLLLPLLVFTAYFVSRGMVKTFWEGAFTYNISYISGLSLSESLDNAINSLKKIAHIDPFTWIAGGMGLWCIFVSKLSLFKKYYIFSVLTGAIAATAMGGHYFQHYFLFILPFMAISAGCGIGLMPKGTMKWRISKVLFLLTCSGILWNCRFITVSNQILLDFCYGDVPYRTKIVGDYLRETVSAGETAYIIGSEPQIYFYANLHSPSRYFYFYPIMEQTQNQPAMRSELITNIQKTPPDYVLFINNHSSHSIDNFDDPFLRKLFHLFDPYTLTGINLSGSNTVLHNEKLLSNWRDLLSNGGSIYIFRKPKETDLTKLPTFKEVLGIGAS